ncbi:antichymotrypsin-2-like [Lucilia cuprina]|uniref:antichymotrypsin-2-like n=1 Tax=Lucilia cuprina TaxID=7375 RepID=UPI001F051FF9|nr:antichymotrypsin-2-like [Lucilia cuprina]
MSTYFHIFSEYNHNRFLVLNFLLALPLTSTADILAELQNFGEQLFHKVCDSHPKEEDQLVGPFPLATLLILLCVNAEKDSAYEITDNLVLDRQNVIEKIDLTAGDTIDGWPSIDICDIETLSSKTHLLLSTEIHFKSLFLYNFASTAKGAFYTIEGEEIGFDVLTLLANLKYGEIPELKANAVEIPYSDGDTSLVIILPNTQGGVIELEQDLKLFPLNGVDSYLKHQWITVVMPKIHIFAEISLKEELKMLGMSRMFNHLCDGKNIQVLDVISNATFSIDEKSAGLDPFLGQDTYNYPPENVSEFHINHPFIFIIKSSLNVIYLYGKLIK